MSTSRSINRYTVDHVKSEYYKKLFAAHSESIDNIIEQLVSSNTMDGTKETYVTVAVPSSQNVMDNDLIVLLCFLGYQVTAVSKIGPPSKQSTTFMYDVRISMDV